MWDFFLNIIYKNDKKKEEEDVMYIYVECQRNFISDKKDSPGPRREYITVRYSFLESRDQKVDPSELYTLNCIGDIYLSLTYNLKVMLGIPMSEVKLLIEGLYFGYKDMFKAVLNTSLLQDPNKEEDPSSPEDLLLCELGLAPAEEKEEPSRAVRPSLYIVSSSDTVPPSPTDRGSRSSSSSRNSSSSSRKKRGNR